MITSRVQGRVAAATALLVVVTMSVLVLRTSSSALMADDVVPGNAWETGRVAVTADSAGQPQAVLPDGSLPSGEAVRRCITVTYAGAVDAVVTLSVGSNDASRASATHVHVEQGDPGTTCAQFSGTAITPTPDPSLAQLQADAAIGHWAAAGSSNESLPYRITLTSPQAQGTLPALTLHWEARGS